MLARILILGVALGALLSPSRAQAVCTLGLTVSSVYPAYEMFDDADLGLVVDFDVTHANGDACSYFVTFSTGGAGSYDRRMSKGADLLSYQIYATASRTNVLKAEIDATASEVLAGTVTTDETSPESLTYFVSIPMHQVAPAGTYSDTFTVTVYEGVLGGQNTLESSDGVTATVVVPKQNQLSLVDTSAGFNPADNAQGLDFGVLEQGESLGFDMLVRSNSGYSVTMSSENKGKLHLTGKSVQDATTVAYTLKVDDAVKDLSGDIPIGVATGAGQTGISGVRHPVLITIGSVTGKAAGGYQDNVTVTVATTE